MGLPRLNWDRVRRERLLKKPSLKAVDGELRSTPPSSKDRRLGSDALTLRLSGGVGKRRVLRRRAREKAGPHRRARLLLRLLEEHVSRTSGEALLTVRPDVALLSFRENGRVRGEVRLPLVSNSAHLLGTVPVGDDGALHCLLAILKVTPPVAWWPVAVDIQPVHSADGLFEVRLISSLTTKSRRRVRPLIALWLEERP